MTVVVLGALVLYTRRAATVGGLVVGTAWRATRDAQIVAVVLLVLVVVGLFHPDLQRANELLAAGRRLIEPEWPILLP